jgi:hypothetical protein
MNDRDIDRAYDEQQAQEDLRWIEKAIPHVVTIAAALMTGRDGWQAHTAVKEAIKTYVLIEQGLINETANI